MTFFLSWSKTHMTKCTNHSSRRWDCQRGICVHFQKRPTLVANFNCLLCWTFWGDLVAGTWIKRENSKTSSRCIIWACPHPRLAYNEAIFSQKWSGNGRARRCAGSTTSASLRLWEPSWTFLCRRSTKQEHPATKCWSAVSSASRLSLYSLNALCSECWMLLCSHSHRSLLEDPHRFLQTFQTVSLHKKKILFQSCNFKLKLQMTDLVGVNASFSHGAKRWHV